MIEGGDIIRALTFGTLTILAVWFLIGMGRRIWDRYENWRIYR